jgi:dTDP-4-amino-4,6-dideoxygalactose transaminase
VHPRLAFDIGWRDLAFALAPHRSSPAAIGATTPGASSVIALSVRTAFDALLGELALPAGSEVLMSAVNIVQMAEIVRAHGLTPVAVDIDIDTLAPSPAELEAAIGPAARMFVLAQLFGARAPTADYADICARHGLVFIEDAAQAFAGALDLPPGVDVSLYSFGPIKTSTALGGAIAVVRDRGLAVRLERRLEAYEPLGGGWFRRRVLKYLALKAFSQPLAFGALVRTIAVLGGDPDTLLGSVARGFPPGDLFARLRRRPPPAMIALMRRRLRQAPDISARRRRSLAVLASLPVPTRVGHRAEAHGYWTTCVASPAPAAVVRRLRSAGFDATRGATSMRALSGTRAPAPNAESLIGEVVYLPVTAGVPERVLPRLAACAAQALATVDQAEARPATPAARSCPSATSPTTARGNQP